MPEFSPDGLRLVDDNISREDAHRAALRKQLTIDPHHKLYSQLIQFYVQASLERSLSARADEQVSQEALKRIPESARFKMLARAAFIDNSVKSAGDKARALELKHSDRYVHYSEAKWARIPEVRARAAANFDLTAAMQDGYALDTRIHDPAMAEVVAYEMVEPMSKVEAYDKKRDHKERVAAELLRRLVYGNFHMPVAYHEARARRYKTKSDDARKEADDIGTSLSYDLMYDNEAA